MKKFLPEKSDVWRQDYISYRRLWLDSCLESFADEMRCVVVDLGGKRQQGNFMALEYPDDSVDMVYSNCVDHAFDLEKFFLEHVDVLKPGGYAIYDVAIFDSGAGAFEAVEWQSEEEVLLLALKQYRKILKIQMDGTWKWMLLQK